MEKPNKIKKVEECLDRLNNRHDEAFKRHMRLDARIAKLEYFRNSVLTSLIFILSIAAVVGLIILIAGYHSCK